MNIVPFEASHLTMIDIQPRQRRSIAYVTLDYLAGLAQEGPARSALVGDRVIACGGVASGFVGIGICWCVVARNAGPHFLGLHRAAQRLLTIPKLRRIESATECDFSQGIRWLEMLGFQREGRMAEYGLDGEDFYLYALTAKRGLLN